MHAAAVSRFCMVHSSPPCTSVCPRCQGGDSAPVQAKPEKVVTKAAAKPVSAFGRAISVLLPILLVLVAIFLSSQKK